MDIKKHTRERHVVTLSREITYFKMVQTVTKIHVEKVTA